MTHFDSLTFQTQVPAPKALTQTQVGKAINIPSSPTPPKHKPHAIFSLSLEPNPYPLVTINRGLNRPRPVPRSDESADPVILQLVMPFVHLTAPLFKYDRSAEAALAVFAARPVGMSQAKALAITPNIQPRRDGRFCMIGILQLMRC